MACPVQWPRHAANSIVNMHVAAVALQEFGHQLTQAVVTVVDAREVGLAGAVRAVPIICRQRGSADERAVLRRRAPTQGA